MKELKPSLTEQDAYAAKWQTTLVNNPPQSAYGVLNNTAPHIIFRDELKIYVAKLSELNCHIEEKNCIRVNNWIFTSCQPNRSTNKDDAGLDIHKEATEVRHQKEKERRKKKKKKKLGGVFQ